MKHQPVVVHLNAVLKFGLMEPALIFGQLCKDSAAKIVKRHLNLFACINIAE